MNWIAKQLYYKVQRQMTGISQITEAQERWMYLYEDKVVTHYREFPIHEVFDISYRSWAVRKGFCICILSRAFIPTWSKQILLNLSRLSSSWSPVPEALRKMQKSPGFSGDLRFPLRSICLCYLCYGNH